ncbi:hypothetical protein SLEP1_g21215 [Rubroshorea leprosula]|uniref:beta-ketoacyl-[acyl-carrier-protein] synthase I n=1 Tax=Rubroshorea leprosula TaxID=152421 RepID=A0AAV5JBC5_9ROSI|nr:hypothetical protein SLEP1_g21215 [Rubroshorea leprosula]
MSLSKLQLFVTWICREKFRISFQTFSGLGLVTPLGHEPDVFYNNLLEGVSGISGIENFDCSQFPTKLAGEIKSLSTEGWVLLKIAKKADKFMPYMLAAGKKALADGGIKDEVNKVCDKSRCGILIGSALGGIQIVQRSVELLNISVRKLPPYSILFSLSNTGSALLAMDLGWMRPNHALSSSCATSNCCLLNAAAHIIRGETDCNGVVIGEGTGVLLLEELEHAKKWGAKIYAELPGGGFTSDAYHMTEPHPNAQHYPRMWGEGKIKSHGRGMALHIEKALAQSGVAREDVNYINAHAASTQVGASGAVEAITTVKRCKRDGSSQTSIWTILKKAWYGSLVANFVGLVSYVHDFGTDFTQDMNLLVGVKKERLDIKVALSNSFGFGGHNSSILLAPFR